jgi:hypothetical protein
MDKTSIAEIFHWLWDTIAKQDTNYRLSILVEEHISAFLYKLAYTFNFLVYSKNFAIRCSTIGFALQEVAIAIDVIH